jgi:drug/metabolite transporter (DMT)-like permease
MTIQALPYILLAGFLFGSTLIASRFGLGQFHPLVFVALRMVIGSLAYGAYYVLSPRRRPWPTDRNLWGHAILLGIIGTAIPMTTVIGSLHYQSAGVTAVLLTSGPAITILIAHFFLADETLTLRKGIGVALALGGALLLAVRGESGLPDVTRANPLGYALVLLAMLAGGAMDVYARKFMRDLDAFDVASIRMFVATLLVLPFTVLFIGIDLQAVNIQGYFVLVYAAIAVNFFGMMLSFYNIKRFGATAAAMTLYVIPVVASVGGILVLGEKITEGMLVGISLIIVGVALINRRRYTTGPTKAI